MDVNGMNNGAALYSMKQALRLPEAVMVLLEKSAGEGGPPLAMKGAAETSAVDAAMMSSGKGRKINVTV